MCDSDVNVGVIEDWTVTRRWFMGTVMAAGMASGACAAENVMEMNVKVTTPDGTADAALFHPAGKGSWPAVLVWPDIFGLRPVFRAMGKRLAAEGFTVLVPNPFYRSASADTIGATIDTSNRDSMSKMFAFRQAMTDEGIDKDAIAYLAFLDSQAATARTRKVGVQGYCMGGPLSFRTAAAVPNRIGAVGSFHGGGLVTQTPASPHLLIPKSNAAYLVAVAKNDDARAPADKDALKAAFAAARKTATVEVYGGDHGWCVPGSQVYNEAEAERAWANLIKLYKASLV
jgi:carboxymethylenebutenolidase